MTRFDQSPDSVSQGVSKIDLMRLHAAIGIPFTTEDHKTHDLWLNPEPWNGYVLHTSGFDARDVLHDLAHWLCAEEERRDLYDFGLFKASVTESQAAEEEAASAIGIFMHWLFSPEDGMKHLEYHGWAETGHETLRSVYGVVNVHGAYRRGIARLEQVFGTSFMNECYRRLGLPTTFANKGGD